VSKALYRIAAAVGSIVLVSAFAACASDAGPDAKGLPAGETVVYHSDYPAYDTLAALYDKADVVVEAHIAGPGEVRQLLPNAGGSDPKSNPNAGVDANQQVAPEPIITTVFKVNVARVFKGSAKAGESIEVKQLGGQYGGVTYKEEGAVALQTDTTYLLFLAVFPDSPASLLNSEQAQYGVETSGSLRRVGGNPLTFSVADLVTVSGGK
jgi:hypothetical protein